MKMTRARKPTEAMVTALAYLREYRQLWDHECDRWECTDGRPGQRRRRLRCEAAEYQRTHCHHGTYTGTWDGPDYMCGYCEDGDTISTRLDLYREAVRRGRAHADRVRRRAFRGMADDLRDRMDRGGDLHTDDKATVEKQFQLYVLLRELGD